MHGKPLSLLGFVLVAAATFGQNPVPDAAEVEKDNPRLERLSKIAARMHDPEANVQELLSEAVRHCGFSIWSENRERVAEPATEPRLGYAITQGEIKAFSEMQKAGHSVTYGNLIATLDYIHAQLGGDGSVGPKVTKVLNSAWRHQKASVRAWGSFIKSVNSQNPNQSTGSFASPENVLSPVEVLFILRVFTEDMTMPLRRFLKAKEKDIPHASTSPLQGGLITLPGWAEGWGEDLGSAGISQAWEYLVENVDLGLGQEFIKKYRDKIGKLNGALALLKVIQTYATLKCTFWVETPGQPLIRTTTTDPGDTRIVASQWTFEMTKLQDFLKENRWFVQLYGIDPDAPHSGPLKDVETEWQIVRYGNSLDIPVNMVGGLDPANPTARVDPSKVRTDQYGTSRVEFEGKKQLKNLNRNQVAPEEKVVQLQVTPQTKGTTMGQDIVDALTGALGLKDGPAGLITPIIECLYRLKWIGTQGYELKVRDWVPGETRGSITIVIKGYGETPATATQGRSWERIDRYIEYKNVVMQDIGVSPPPPLQLPPGMSALHRQQVMDLYNQSLEASKERPFVSEGPGSGTRAMNDGQGGDTWSAGGCGEEAADVSYTETTKAFKNETYAKGDFFAGNAPDTGFAVTIDLRSKTAVVQVKHHLEALVKRVATGADGTTVESERNANIDLLRELNFEKGIEMPVTHVEDVGSKQVVFRGGITGLQFKFGPDNKYTGTCAILFRLVRVPKKGA